jgi:hypothetical protein
MLRFWKKELFLAVSLKFRTLRGPYFIYFWCLKPTSIHYRKLPSSKFTLQIARITLFINGF